MNYKLVAVDKIVADAKQPREYFDPAKMATLKSSIQKHGIKTPLNVEEVGDGTYILEDGERRLRTAKELGMKEVPCAIFPLESEGNRLIKQFNIQEQHEGWTPVEKARAVIRTSEFLGTSLLDTCKLLDVPKSSQLQYSAFAKLASKVSYIKNEIPLDYAQAIVNIGVKAKELQVRVLEKDFTKEDGKHLEEKIIQNIRTGVIQKKGDIVILKDAFTKNPKLITKYIEDAKATPTSMYTESKAKGAYHLRNMVNNAMYVTSHGRRFLELNDVKLTPSQAIALKESAKTAKMVADLYVAE